MNLPTLWVVLPIYNEAAAIKGVVEEWVEALRSLNVSFAILAIDDGSKDHTAAILKSLGILELQIIQRQNSGHGPSCRFGYQTALEQGAGWVLQIDSDGQCDPRYFPRFWAARQNSPVVFGCRTKGMTACAVG